MMYPFSLWSRFVTKLSVVLLYEMTGMVSVVHSVDVDTKWLPVAMTIISAKDQSLANPFRTATVVY